MLDNHPEMVSFLKKQRIVICILPSTCPLPVSTITFLKGWLLLRHFFAIFQLCKVHFVSLDFGLCRKLLRGRNWWGKRPKSPLTQYWHQSRVWHGKGVFIKCIHQSFRLQRIGSQVLRRTWSDFRHWQTKCKEKACLSGSLQSISIKDLSLDSLYRQDSPSSRQHSYLIPSRTTLLFTFLFSVVSFFRYWKCTTSVVKSGFFIRNWGYGLLHFLFED